MTAQFSERLVYDGQTLPLRSTPLAQYLKEHGKNDVFLVTSTANWRGYVGSWEIMDNRLYLTGISGKLKDGSAASLPAIFETEEDRVFADWYSGTLRIPDGELLEYVHLGFASRYERERLLEIVNGALVSTRIQDTDTSVAVASGQPRQTKRPGFVARLFGRAHP